MSTCPHDLPPVPLNGPDFTPRDIAYDVERA
jgi:hypothetical protein